MKCKMSSEEPSSDGGTRSHRPHSDLQQIVTNRGKKGFAYVVSACEGAAKESFWRES
jgi:hypothetical protein